MQIDGVGLFDAYFRGHAARVYAFALRRTDPQAAQEVIAETFLIAWRRRAEMPTEPCAMAVQDRPLGTRE